MGLFDIPDTVQSPAEYGQYFATAMEQMANYFPAINDLMRQESLKNTSTQNVASNFSLFGAGETPGYINMLATAQPLISGINSAANTSKIDSDINDVEQYAGRFIEMDRAANGSLFDQMEQQQIPSAEMNLLRDRGIGDLNAISGIDSLFAQDNARLRGFQDTAAEGVRQGGQFQDRLGREREELTSLRQSPLDILRNEGRLTSEQARNVSQDSRAADQSRGVLRSGMSIGNEILNSDLARKRNMAFADSRLAGIEGLVGNNENRTRTDTAFADQRLANMQNLLGQSEGRNLAIRNNLLQSGMGVEGMRFGQGQQRINNRIMTRRDPLQMVLGRPSVNQATGPMAAGMANQGVMQGMNGSMGFFDQFTTMAGGLAGMGQSGINAQASARADRDAGIFGALGPIIGAGIGLLCWVAREVYGEENQRWMMFREWLLNASPLWFLEWYIKNGPSYAEYIKDKPVLKSRIKNWMDGRIRVYYGI